MTRVRGRQISTPEVSLVFKDYASPPNQMKGRFALSKTPNTLRRRWLMQALCYTADEAHNNLERCHISNIEQLGSLDNIIVGGKIDQPLKFIDENIKDDTTLMVSWHWIGNCDGEFHIEQLDDS